MDSNFPINEPKRPEMTLREVSQAKVIAGPNGKLVFSYFTRKQDDAEVLLSFVELDDEKLQPLRGYTRIRVTSVSMEEQKLAACTLIESSQGLELVSICKYPRFFLLKWKIRTCFNAFQGTTTASSYAIWTSTSTLMSQIRSEISSQT